MNQIIRTGLLAVAIGLFVVQRAETAVAYSCEPQQYYVGPGPNGPLYTSFREGNAGQSCFSGNSCSGVAYCGKSDPYTGQVLYQYPIWVPGTTYARNLGTQWLHCSDNHMHSVPVCDEECFIDWGYAQSLCAPGEWAS